MRFPLRFAAALKNFYWWLAAATLLGVYLIVRHFYGNVGNVTSALLDPGCPDGAKALTAPTLARMYDHSLELAKQWKPDVVVVRLDNLAMRSPLQPDGSSKEWSAEFYSPATKAAFQVHTGDGQIFCSHRTAESQSALPKLKPDFMRDGAALYAIAEKRGRQHLAQGRGIGVVLWSTAEGDTTWVLEYVDSGGYPADLRVRVDPNTGKEEVRK